VSQEGKVYACGEGTNGRLGLGHCANISVPRQLSALAQYVVKKVSVHSGGKHAMALTVDGRVFSWGEGEDGKLGHCSRLLSDKPRVIEARLETKFLFLFSRIFFGFVKNKFASNLWENEILLKHNM